MTTLLLADFGKNLHTDTRAAIAEAGYADCPILNHFYLDPRDQPDGNGLGSVSFAGAVQAMQWVLRQHRGDATHGCIDLEHPLPSDAEGHNIVRMMQRLMPRTAWTSYAATSARWFPRWNDVGQPVRVHWSQLAERQRDKKQAQAEGRVGAKSHYASQDWLSIDAYIRIGYEELDADRVRDVAARLRKMAGARKPILAFIRYRYEGTTTAVEDDAFRDWIAGIEGGVDGFHLWGAENEAWLESKRVPDDRRTVDDTAVHYHRLLRDITK